MTASNLAVMSVQKLKITVDELQNLMQSAPEGMFDWEPMGKPRLEQVITRIIETNGSHMDEIRNIRCKNCLKKGHGAAWACPLPRNPSRFERGRRRHKNRELLLD